jgi:hypothetical protein
MKTILYADDLTALGEKLKSIIQTQVSGTQLENCNSIAHISQILRQPLNNVSVLVLLLSSKDELIQFNSMNILFDNLRIILVLPDNKKEMLSLGLKLKPSFISDVDCDLQDVVSVLRQIIKKENK